MNDRKKLKIALFLEAYHPHVNGVITHVDILRTMLSKAGHEVLIVTSGANEWHHRLEDGVLYCPALSLKRFYGYGVATPFSYKTTRMLRKFDPDIIHVHQEFGVSLRGINYAIMYNKPVVYTLHTMYEEYIHYLAPEYLYNFIRFTWRIITRYITVKATVITSPSAKAIPFLRNYGVKTPVKVIPNTIDPTKFVPAEIDQNELEKFKAKIGVAKFTFLALFVGRLGTEKSIDYLLKAWAQNFSDQKNMGLIIVGDGPDRELLQQLTQELGIGEQVIFTGKVLHDEVARFMLISQCFVSASVTEMMSISMLESMSCGIPPVLRFDAGNAKQLSDGKNAFYYKNEIEMGQIITRLRDMSNEERSALSVTLKAAIDDINTRLSSEFLSSLYYEALRKNKSIYAQFRNYMRKYLRYLWRKNYLHKTWKDYWGRLESYRQKKRW